jgi:transcription elongation GreA/GreB family factor
MTNAGQRSVYLTAEGRRRLEQRLQGYSEQLQRLQSPPPVDEARDWGDQATQLDSADDLARLSDQIAVLQDTLSRARPLDAGPDDGVVRHGSRVTVRDEQGGARRFKLLDGVELEENPEEVSLDSPMGQALLDRTQGEAVTVHLPSGEQRFTITSVEPYRPPAP